jgi:uncharacterized zinc-type alcohol dehydrogenase-like protein
MFPLISTAKGLCGSNTGSPSRMAEMLDVAARHHIGAKTERYKMSEATQAVKKVRKNQVRYRAVLVG